MIIQLKTDIDLELFERQVNTLAKAIESPTICEQEKDDLNGLFGIIEAINDQIDEEKENNSVQCPRCCIKITHKKGVESVKCPHCGLEDDVCHFPDVNY